MKKTLLAASLAVLGLSACGSLNDKTPYEMAQISMARSLKQDHSYNFQGEMRAYLSKPQEGVAPETVSANRQAQALADETAAADEAITAASAAAAAADAAAASDASPAETEQEAAAAIAAAQDEAAAMQAFIDAYASNMGGKMADYLQEYPALAHYIANGRLKVDGALDLRAEKMELTPELVLQGRNEYTSIKVPMLFNGKDMSVTVDTPALVPVVLGFFTDMPMRERLIHEPIRFTLSDEDKKGLPLRNAMNAFVQAAYSAYSALPPEAFRLKEMDAFGKQTGSRYRVEYSMNTANSRLYDEALLRDFLAKLDELERTTPEAGATAEGYEEVREFARQSLEANQMFDADKMLGSLMFTSLYLDRKGRLLGLRQYMQLNGSKAQALNLDAGVKLFNYGKPVFAFKPQNAKVIEIADLIKSVKSQDAYGLSAIDGYDDTAYDSGDVEDIELPQAPNVIEEHVVGRKAS